MGTKWSVLKAGWACSVHNHYLISPSLRTDPTSASLELTLLPGPKPFASHLQVREKTQLPSATTGELFTVLFTCRWLSIIWSKFINQSASHVNRSISWLLSVDKDLRRLVHQWSLSLFPPHPTPESQLNGATRGENGRTHSHPSQPLTLCHSGTTGKPRFITSLTVCFMPMALSVSFHLSPATNLSGRLSYSSQFIY